MDITHELKERIKEATEKKRREVELPQFEEFLRKFLEGSLPSFSELQENNKQTPLVVWHYEGRKSEILIWGKDIVLRKPLSNKRLTTENISEFATLLYSEMRKASALWARYNEIVEPIPPEEILYTKFLRPIEEFLEMVLDDKLGVIPLLVVGEKRISLAMCEADTPKADEGKYLHYIIMNGGLYCAHRLKSEQITVDNMRDHAVRLHKCGFTAKSLKDEYLESIESILKELS